MSLGLSGSDVPSQQKAGLDVECLCGDCRTVFCTHYLFLLVKANTRDGEDWKGEGRSMQMREAAQTKDLPLPKTSCHLIASQGHLQSNV